MKPVFHTGRPARDGETQSAFNQNNHAPSTDWSYQASASIFRGGAGSFGTSRTPVCSFRSIGNGFEAEARREGTITASIFTLIAVMTVWPIVMAAQAAWQLVH